MKRIISLLLCLITAGLCLTSCLGGDGQPQITQDGTDESSTAIEDLVLHSLYAKQAAITLDQFKDYICYVPEEGTEEAKRWERIYIDPVANSDLLVSHQDGECYEIIYSGEIATMAYNEYGFIENLYSIRIKSDPREYGGIGYEVAIMTEHHDGDKFKEDTGSNKVLVKSKNELSEMVNKYFLFQQELPENATDLQKKYVPMINNRTQLIDGYDEKFFEQYDLFIMLISSGSGSDRFDVTDISIESGICTVTYENTVQGQTDDIGEWIIFVAIPKEVSESVTEFKTFMPTPEWYS